MRSLLEIQNLAAITLPSAASATAAADAALGEGLVGFSKTRFYQSLCSPGPSHRVIDETMSFLHGCRRPRIY